MASRSYCLGVANEVLRLAYETGVATLAEQDGTLGNLRSRATGLLAATSLGTTVAAGVGLYKAEPGTETLPTWAGWLLLIETLLIGSFVVYVCSPVDDWKYGLDASAVLGLEALGVDRLDDFYRGAASELAKAATANQISLRRRFVVYRWSLIGLIVQAATVIVAVTFR